MTSFEKTRDIVMRTIPCTPQKAELVARRLQYERAERIHALIQIVVLTVLGVATTAAVAMLLLTPTG